MSDFLQGSTDLLFQNIHWELSSKLISPFHAQSFLEGVCSGTASLSSGLSVPLIQRLSVQITGWNLWGYKDEGVGVLPLGIHSAVTEKADMQMTLTIIGYSELCSILDIWLFKVLKCSSKVSWSNIFSTYHLHWGNRQKQTWPLASGSPQSCP